MPRSQFNSFTMTVWYCHTSCPAFTYQWCVRRRDLRRSSATTQCKEQGTNFHIHHCANPKFKSYFQYFFLPSKLFFPSKRINTSSQPAKSSTFQQQPKQWPHLAGNCNIPPGQRSELVMARCDAGLIWPPTETWSGEVSVSNPDTDSQSWCSVGRPVQFPRWPVKLTANSKLRKQKWWMC